MPRLNLQINNARRTVDTDSDRSLLSVLREDLDLTGTKYGCGEGQCGACTVLIAGKAVRACVTSVGSVQNQPIVTIEGLETQGRLHRVQQAFLDAGAMQCGFCTTGMIMSAVGLLSSRPAPSRADILQGMEGNICRCGTHLRVIQAIQSAARNGGGQ